jgi:hypothetical protein
LYSKEYCPTLSWVHSQDDEIEVIGNIYENAELTKGIMPQSVADKRMAQEVMEL